MFSGVEIARQAPARGWSALSSFTFEAALVAAALAYPWFHTETLPSREHPLFLPLSTTAATRADENRPAGGRSSRAMAPIVVARPPLSFGRQARRAEEAGALAPDIDSIGAENPGDVLRSILSNSFPAMPRPARPATLPRVSAVMEGNLIYRVEPQYPAIAQQLHIEGTVVVKAFISREGRIERAQAERGQPWLAQAALKAVRQWRYRPYYLNHEAIAVETEITVNFVLER